MTRRQSTNWSTTLGKSHFFTFGWTKVDEAFWVVLNCAEGIRERDVTAYETQPYVSQSPFCFLMFSHHFESSYHQRQNEPRAWNFAPSFRQVVEICSQMYIGSGECEVSKGNVISFSFLIKRSHVAPLVRMIREECARNSQIVYTCINLPRWWWKWPRQMTLTQMSFLACYSLLSRRVNRSAAYAIPLSIRRNDKQPKGDGESHPQWTCYHATLHMVTPG